MTNQLAVIEKQLRSVEPHFAEVLKTSGVPAERVIRTVMVSLERLPKLQECSLQSIMNAAMSAAVLGLEVDGVTGQAFLVPFGGKAQLIIGYKGYNTLAARSGYTIRAGIIREGDEFAVDKPAGKISHNAKLGNTGRIIGAWSLGASNTLPSICEALSIAELMQVKAKSPGARIKDSPWNDANGPGFPAMCEKTVRRRLARSMPMNVMQYAAAMDQAFEEEGKSSYISPDNGVVIEGEATEVEPMGDRDQEQPSDLMDDGPAFTIVGSDGSSHTRASIDQWVSVIEMGLAKMSSAEQVESFAARMGTVFKELHDKFPAQVEGVIADCKKLRAQFAVEPLDNAS